ncbi:retrovirus-related pol polyprotein from transposon TNT 1-94 [Tanacetum coccineum]
MDSVSEPTSNAHVKHSVRNAKFESICAICNKCLFNANHDMYVIDYVKDVNVHSKSKSKRNKMRKVWKPTGKVFNEIGYSWKPIGRTFTIIRNKCPLTRITSTKVVPTKETTNKSILTPTQGIIVYSRRPKAPKLVGSSSKSKIIESRIYKSSDPTQSGGSTISDVPYSSLNACRLSKLFCGLVQGLPKVKYQKDHLCSACALGISKKHSHKPKAEDSIQEKLYLLHMDICGPMRIQSINGRKYILVIVDDYSQFTWVKFLRSKDEVPDFMIKFLKMIQVRLNATVCNIKTDNGIEFVNQTLRAYYEDDSCKTFFLQHLIAREPDVSTDTPSSTIIDQDASSTSTSHTNQETPSPVIPLGVEEANHDIEVAYMDNNPYVDFPIPEPSSEESSSQFPLDINYKMKPYSVISMLSFLLLKPRVIKKH